MTVRGQGLDGRDSSREVWSGLVAANTTIEVPFPFSSLPVQSIGKKASAQIYTQIAAAPGDQAHLVGVVSRSQPLAYSFDPTYAYFTSYGSDEHEASVLEGVSNQADIANRIGALGVALTAHAGRVWNGTSFDDVGVLGANVLDEATVFGSHVFSDADAAQFDMYPAPTFPWGSDDAGARVCAAFLTRLEDDGRGETVVLGEEASPANTRMEVYEFESNGAGTLLWAGSSNVNGCSPRLEGVVQGRSYVLKVESRLRLPVRNVDVTIKAPPRNSMGNEQLGNGGADFSHVVAVRAFSLDTTPFGTNTVRMKFTTNRAFDAALSVGQVMARLGDSIPENKHFGVMLDRCQGRPSSKSNPTACATGPILWLGSNARDYVKGETVANTSHNVDWKFVVAHEFGHVIFDAYNAVPKIAYGDNGAGLYCECEHVTADEDKEHCMQSREPLGGVAAEAQAHAVAAGTWNLPSESACQFVYYKNMRIPFLAIISAPVPVTCTSQVKWLENTCLAADRGVEWDWMNWMHNVNIAPSGSVSSIGDVADVFVRACGGTSCTGLTPTPGQLITAARTKYGLGSPKALRLENAVNNYGANH